MPAVTVLAGAINLRDLVEGLESCGVVVILSGDRPGGRSLVGPANAAIEREEGDYSEVALVEHEVMLEGERKYVPVYIYHPKVPDYQDNTTFGHVERAVARWHKIGKPDAYGWSALK
jgi:hypothetical protein